MMQMFKRLFILTTFFYCSVNTFAQDILPKDLSESILYFEKKWTSEEKKIFQSKPEAIAVSELQTTTGMWIRNNWLRGKKDTILLRFFMDKGVMHPDEMSDIILTALHRKLNNKQIDVEGQLNKYQTHFPNLPECQQEIKLRALNNYKKFKEHDPVIIYLYVDVKGEKRNAIFINCPQMEWEFDSDKDLKLEAVITKKYINETTKDLFFEVKLKKINFPDTTILGEEIEVDDLIDFDLKLLRVE